MLALPGLRLSPPKTLIVHMSDPLDFLGFRIQWRRKRGTSKWYVSTFIADWPVRSLKEKSVPSPTGGRAAPQGRADPAQPDHARIGQLLQARSQPTHLQLLGVLRMAPRRHVGVGAAHRARQQQVAPSWSEPDRKYMLEELDMLTAVS
ncbi:hypothetical protein ACPPVO_54190 [Dactylosporangium sp. McL0621]|uniref:hypothetical protein n=1 Tax=Dactylosporangium sp. McL0621 TaxID=3415678 RepID=UPI003CF9777E